MKKKSWKFIVSLWILFIVPWTHHFVYLNILKAVPSIVDSGAHTLAVILSVFAGIALMASFD